MATKKISHTEIQKSRITVLGHPLILKVVNEYETQEIVEHYYQFTGLLRAP